MRPFPIVFLLASLPLIAQIPLRVGISTDAVEHVVALEGGGEICARNGKVLLKVKDGEKLRLWWDSRGEADPTDEYRVQVAGPQQLDLAEALMQRLRALGEQPERLKVWDGDSWRVVLGHFEQVEETEPLLEKLRAAGYDELWVATERRPGKPRVGRALYAVTERFERRPLPNDGVWLKPKGELVTVVGKGRYRGKMEVIPNAQGRLNVVNTVEMETYLRGVVPKEMGAWEFPALEALKAQAVAARTYALANRGKRSKEGYDLVDTVADQVYGGRDGEQALTDRAVEETRGVVARYNGRPIQALFMANSGGHTVDNTHVFGGGHPYLQAVSNYIDQPSTLKFSSRVAPQGDQTWLNWELLRLAAEGLVPEPWLDTARLAQPLRASDLQAPLAKLAQRLGFLAPQPCGDQGSRIFLWLGRSLEFDRLAKGQERAQDGRYFLGATDLKASELPLASLLARRGIVPPTWWRGNPNLAQGLVALAKLWQELEPLELSEGTLLKDGQVRVKNAGPGPLNLASAYLLAEEAPSGSLRLVGESTIQVGDKVKWVKQEGASRLLVRRLDPDGSSLDRYNPTAHWRQELKESELLGRLQQRVGVKSIKAMEATHNEHGRVTELVVKDGAGASHRFTGMRIRGLLGLKDNVFQFVQVGKGSQRRWIFYGRGWGHGVGMDQTGAYGYALEGWTFEQIVKHYYRGIELTKVDR